MCISRKDRFKKRTIAIVTKSTTICSKTLKYDDLVDPRMTTVSRIMEHVHKGTIGTVYHY